MNKTEFPDVFIISSAHNTVYNYSIQYLTMCFLTMGLLQFNINYRSETFEADATGAHVPVKLKAGKGSEFRYLRWLGYISLQAARESPGSPVKIGIQRYSLTEDFPQWVSLQSGQYLQGCLVTAGVYGIWEAGKPRIIPLDTTQETLELS